MNSRSTLLCAALSVLCLAHVSSCGDPASGTGDPTAYAAGTDQDRCLDPIRTDDVILNPVYDPERQPVAVLLGNGFGRYNANDMKSMLAEVGVQVREEISNESDMLLLGTPFFDDETGEVVPWESQDAYKAAASYSVQVIPLRDWTQWLGK